MHHSKKLFYKLKIIDFFSKNLSNPLGIKDFYKPPFKNLLPVGIFTLCLLFSFNSFAIGNGLLRLFRGGKSTNPPPVDNPYQPPTPEEIGLLTRKRHGEQIENIHGISERAVHHLARDIDEQFNRTLGEILEIKKIEVPEAMLDELRAATTDPLRLFDPDNPSPVANAVNFNRTGLHDSIYSQFPQFPLPGRVIEDTLAYRDIYRAFFQKRLDPNNSQQMYRLKNLLERLAKELETDPYEVLRFLCKHDGFKKSAYEHWASKFIETLYEDEFFKKLADYCFKDGFDSKTFFALWEDKSFRQFIIDSKFMTKAHLTGNVDLLIEWKREIPHYLFIGADDQLDVFIRSSLHEASLKTDVNKALSNDPFWKTLVRAAREKSLFSWDFERRLQRITPVKQDQPPSGGFGDDGLA